MSKRRIYEKTKIIALAMSVSLVLGGAYIIDSKTNIAYAEEEKPSPNK